MNSKDTKETYFTYKSKIVINHVLYVDDAEIAFSGISPLLIPNAFQEFCYPNFLR